jgi:hypothetical protein
MGLDGAQFALGSLGKVRLETVLDHGGMSRNDKIEVDWMSGGNFGGRMILVVGWHRNPAP